MIVRRRTLVEWMWILTPSLGTAIGGALIVEEVARNVFDGDPLAYAIGIGIVAAIVAGAHGEPL